MGNLNCLSCINYFSVKQSNDGGHLEIVSKCNQFTELYTECESQIISIQKYWKGYSKKKHYQFLKKLRISSSFFPRVDLFETLFDRQVEKTTEVRRYEYLSGTVYEGEWLGGFRHGTGKCIWSDGSIYEGSWSYGYPNNSGTFNHSDGDSFSGKWISPYSNSKISQSKKDGFGKTYVVWLSTKNQLKIKKTKSQLKQIELLQLNLHSLHQKFSDLREEFTQKSSNGSIFESSGIMHKGDLIEGQKSGFGITTWGNGDRFTGFWKNNIKNGLGKEEWADGSSFFGTYVKGYKEGLGHYFWEDGSEYKGEWSSNQCDGLGIYVWKDGRSYEGYWKEGLMHGFGVFAWPNGIVYEGEWAYGKKHGIGVSRSSDGSETRDLWEFGRIKRLS
jgi:hypothetical protein